MQYTDSDVIKSLSVLSLIEEDSQLEKKINLLTRQVQQSDAVDRPQIKQDLKKLQQRQDSLQKTSTAFTNTDSMRIYYRWGEATTLHHIYHPKALGKNKGHHFVFFPHSPDFRLEISENEDIITLLSDLTQEDEIKSGWIHSKDRHIFKDVIAGQNVSNSLTDLFLNPEEFGISQKDLHSQSSIIYGQTGLIQEPILFTTETTYSPEEYSDRSVNSPEKDKDILQHMRRKKDLSTPKNTIHAKPNPRPDVESSDEEYGISIWNTDVDYKTLHYLQDVIVEEIGTNMKEYRVMFIPQKSLST